MTTVPLTTRQGWTTTYEPVRRLVTCTCGHRKRAADDVHADRLMELHDDAHRALATAAEAGRLP